MPYDLSACGLVTVSQFLVQDDSTTGKGVVLRNGDLPLITRGWDCFTSGNKSGIGRWGLFMEAGETFLAAPGTDYGGARIGLGGYLADGTKQDTLTVTTCTRRVGIGTNCPLSALHVASGPNTNGLFISKIDSCTNKQSIFISADDSVGAYIAGGTCPNGTATQTDGFGRIILQNGPAEGLQFQTSAVTAGSAQSWNTRMVIKNNGKVGIGATSPNGQLTVSVDQSVNNQHFNIVGTQTSYSQEYSFGIPTSTKDLRIYDGTAGATRLTLTCLGNIGLGTTAPGTNLEVNGTDAEMMVHNPSNSRGGFRAFCNQRLGILTTDPSDSLVFGFESGHKGAFTERMRVCNITGNVSIGTSNTCSRFTVSDGCSYFYIVGNSAGDFQAPNLSPHISTGCFTIFCGNIGSGVARLRITQNGDVGVNTTSPSYRLHVNGTFYAAGSSQDYKEGVCKYDTDSCMFMKLKPVTYQYKQEFKHLGKELKSQTQIGLIAEEVAEVAPELAILVKENDNDVVRNVDYEKLSILLLSEVQKLRKEVDDLKTK